jgi:hypothetical protein
VTNKDRQVLFPGPFPHETFIQVVGNHQLIFHCRNLSQLHMQQIDQPERNHQKDAQTDHGNDRIDERSAHQAAAQP